MIRCGKFRKVSYFHIWFKMNFEMLNNMMKIKVLENILQLGGLKVTG